jgi:hypothetical protein
MKSKTTTPDDLASAYDARTFPLIWGEEADWHIWKAKSSGAIGQTNHPPGFGHRVGQD